MNALISPAVALMHRLTLTSKFVLCALLLLSPAILFYLQAHYAVQSLQLQLVGLLLAMVALYFTTAFCAATRQSINSLLQTVKTMASGELAVRSNLDSRDEFGLVAISLNEMARETGRVIKDVHAAADEVANAASELASAAARVVVGATEQTELSAISTEAVKRMRSSVEEVASAAQLSQSIAEEAERQSESGAQVVHAAGDEMELIQKSMIQLSELVSSMGHRSDAISGIVNTIREIADQTNLLALNAAIEAARAGEHGRGFAVVADEVRKLAARTAIATTEISSMINGILGELKATVTGMENGRSQAEKGVIMAREAAQALESIREGARSTMDRVRSIALATQEQTRTSQHAVDNMGKIATKSQENTAASNEAASVSQYLENLAASLRQAVLRFKI